MAKIAHAVDYNIALHGEPRLKHSSPIFSSSILPTRAASKRWAHLRIKQTGGRLACTCAASASDGRRLPSSNPHDHRSRVGTGNISLDSQAAPWPLQSTRIAFADVVVAPSEELTAGSPEREFFIDTRDFSLHTEMHSLILQKLPVEPLLRTSPTNPGQRRMTKPDWVRHPQPESGEASTVPVGRSLNQEIGQISLPAMVALIMDPLSVLVDTAFLGHLGAVAQASIGVALFPLNFVAKLLDLPLANVTSTLVAAADAATRAKAEDSSISITGFSQQSPSQATESIVGSAMVLATIMGFFQAALLLGLAPTIISLMGASAGSPMAEGALLYFRLRALGMPAVVLAMTSQGVFRGFGDTKTPLRFSASCNVLNIVLDYLFLFQCHWGIVGAASSVLCAQYLCCILSLGGLARRVRLIPRSFSSLQFGSFASACAALIPRTFASISTMTVAASLATRLGPAAMAAHNICFQLWLSASLVADSLAFAAQTLVSRARSAASHSRVRAIVHRTLAFGGLMGVFLTGAFFTFKAPLASFFSSDPHVLSLVSSVMPWVALSMPFNTLAFVWDGALFGAEDYGFSALAMIVAAIPVIGWFLLTVGSGGGSPADSLGAIWGGLACFMAIRLATCTARYVTRTGPWKSV